MKRFFLLLSILVIMFFVVACESEAPLDSNDQHSVDTLVILDSAFVFDTVAIYDTTVIYDTSVVYDSVFTYDSIFVFDTTTVYDTTIFVETVFINDTTVVYDSVFVFDTLMVYDTTVVYDSMIVIDTVFISDTTIVYSWQFDANLQAGPYSKFDSRIVSTGQDSSWNRVWFYIKMDVPNFYREIMTLEFVYVDGSRRYWEIPDILADRPAYILVDGGEALIEPTIKVNWYYLGGVSTVSGTDVVNCDYWNRVLEISGSREIPANHAGISTIKVEGISQKPLD